MFSELKWTRMGEFNSDDHYIYYCGQESLRRNGVAIMVNKRVQNAVLGCQYSCLENPRDGEAWWAAVSGVTQSRTRLKRLSIA